MNMYLKLARGIRVARILVRVHQLGLQKPETRPTDSNHETGTVCAKITTVVVDQGRPGGG